MNREKIREILIRNDFISINDPIPTPLIAVFRNTAFIKNKITFLEDHGDDITDTVFLIDDKDIFELMGRSYPHDKYQARMVNNTGKANYIASSYTFEAFRRWLHLGEYPALGQNKKFVVWRSQDMDLKDDDDYSESGIVHDNFHGWAPSSAGCVTVRGKMGKYGHPEYNTDDWKLAYEWIYKTCKDDSFFNAAILEYFDVAYPSRRLRVGSHGQNVFDMQTRLQDFGLDIKPDKDFGPWTHEMVRRFQRFRKLDDIGIYCPNTEKELWSVT